MTTVQTLFGTFTEEQLQVLGKALDEMEIVMRKMDDNKSELKDIIDATHETLNLPKKIIRKMAKVKYKQTFQTEVAENKEFEVLFENAVK